MYTYRDHTSFFMHYHLPGPEDAVVHFLTLDFFKQNGVSCVLLNVITSSQPFATFSRTKTSGK